MRAVSRLPGHGSRRGSCSGYNKRVRALSTWVAEAARLGLEVVDLVRADRDYAITTPENDILLLRKPD